MTERDGPREEHVRARAYQIFKERGGQPGHEMDDWVQAEYELLQLPVHKIAEISPAPAGKQKNYRRMALVSLVQSAMLISAEAWPHWKS
jgi:hypothetical protein